MNGDAAFFALRSEVFGEAPHLVREHLTAQQTAGYIDQNLSSEELLLVADHLSHCAHCEEAVDDLHTFRSQIAPSLEREYHPAPDRSPAEGWWSQRVASLQEMFRRPPALAFGAVLTALLLAVTGWLIWRTPRERVPDQLAVVTPAPLSIPSPVSVPLVAQLKDGEGQLTLDQEGKLSGADHLPATYQSLLKEALTSGRLERSSSLSGLARPPSSLMSSDKQRGKFLVIEPAGNVVMSDRPTFRWSSMERATSYLVEVYDNEFNPVVTSPQVTRESWVPPQSLPRGKVYSWQVKAIKDGQEFQSPLPPAPQARFRILDQTKAIELARARRAYASSHLALGLLYAKAGLLREAERELRALQKANPDSEIARSLLGKVQALRR